MALGVDASSTFAVVGLLSLAYDSNIRCCPRRGSGSQGALRRHRIRTLAKPFVESPSAHIALRFVLAAIPPPEFSSEGQGHAARALAALRSEAAHSGDLLFVNQSEGFVECAKKYLLFYREALALFPHARFLASGDDDVYIQFDHLYAHAARASLEPCHTPHRAHCSSTTIIQPVLLESSRHVATSRLPPLLPEPRPTVTRPLASPWTAPLLTWLPEPSLCVGQRRNSAALLTWQPPQPCWTAPLLTWRHNSAAADVAAPPHPVGQRR